MAAFAVLNITLKQNTTMAQPIWNGKYAKLLPAQIRPNQLVVNYCAANSTVTNAFNQAENKATDLKIFFEPTNAHHQRWGSACIQLIERRFCIHTRLGTAFPTRNKRFQITINFWFRPLISRGISKLAATKYCAN